MILLVPIVFYILTLKQIQAPGPNDPLVVKCDNTKERCWLSDINIVRDLEWSEKPSTVTIYSCFPKPPQDTSVVNIHIIKTEDEIPIAFIGQSPVCEHPYQPTMLGDDNIEVGYAIEPNYKKHNWPESIILKNMNEQTFFWFQTYRLMQEIAKGNPLRTKHRIIGNRKTQGTPCKDYRFGIDNSKKYDYITDLYSSKNLQKIFQKQSNRIRDKIFALKEKVARTLESHPKVVPRQLVPIDDFYEESYRKSTCTYLNTVPLYEGVHTSVQRVENYIRTVSQVLGDRPLQIWTEIRYTSDQAEIRPVNLDSKNSKYQIPDHFIKIITYQVPSLPDGWMNYSIAIVIHNKQENQSRAICTNNVGAEWGWDVSDIEGGLTYCCAIADLNNDLKIQHLSVQNMPLNLKKIPIYYNDGEIVRQVDIRRFMKGKIPPLTIGYDTDDKTYKLYELQKLRNDETSSFSHVLLCCPAETIDEQVTALISNTNQLFIREIFRSIYDIPTNLYCTSKFEPSVSSGVKYDNYSIGYAIRVNTDILDQHNLPSMEKPTPTSPYFWIGGIEIVYNIFLLKASHTKHTIYPREHKTDNHSFCSNNNTGLEKFTEYDINIDVLYDDPNLEQILAKFQTSENISLTQLSPIRDFDDEQLQLTTCTYLNIVPILQSIYEGPIQKLENYIQNLIDNKPDLGQLEITTLVHDTLTLVTKENYNEPVYLDASDPNSPRLPVPRLFIKVIARRVFFTSEEKESLKMKIQKTDEQRVRFNFEQFETPTDYELYAMAIIIHNEPSSADQPVKPICPNICDKYAWNVQQFDDHGRIYCCHLNELNELVGPAKMYGTLKTKPFDLNEPIDETERLEDRRSPDSDTNSKKSNHESKISSRSNS